GSRRRGCGGIAGDDGFEAWQARQHWHDAGKLLFLLHGIRAWPGGLAADIDDGSAGIRQLGSMEDRLLLCVVEAAVRERVWRDIDDAHDERAIEAETGKGRARSGHASKHFT